MPTRLMKARRCLSNAEGVGQQAGASLVLRNTPQQRRRYKMDNRSKASVAAASLVGSLLLIATTSGAQPQGDVVIEKHITPMTRYVSFADLSLATKQDQKV